MPGCTDAHLLLAHAKDRRLIGQATGLGLTVFHGIVSRRRLSVGTSRACRASRDRATLDTGMTMSLQRFIPRATPYTLVVLLALGGCAAKQDSAPTASGGTGGIGGMGGLAGAGGAGGASTGASGGGGRTTSVPGSGGRSEVGGGDSGDSGPDLPAASACKRGIAANVAPATAFFPAVRWWYNWAIRPPANVVETGIAFVPMIWDEKTAGNDIPMGTKYLLGFNEPNFFAQADLSPEQAASHWKDVETSARAQSVPIVSPALNYCGPADQCHGTNPYQYLKDFFRVCAGCQVDHVAVHWYNCDLPSLRDYLEPGGNLEGFEQFGLPIWLTEFSCDPSASAAQQESYMREAIPYLEGNPHVFRYAWFSADPIPKAKLMNGDGSPTPLGQVYASLPSSCP